MKIRRVFLVFGVLLGTAWAQETVLYSFCARYPCLDGANPVGGLVSDQKGNLYGTTNAGGAEEFAAGVIFQLTPLGKYTILHTFCSQNNCADGAIPNGGLVFDQNGNLYGTTTYGGIYNGGNGVVFKLSTTTGRYSVLYSFCARINCADGALPNARLVFDQNGNLYGTTVGGGVRYGGFPGNGVVFKLTPNGRETVLYNFCTQNHCPDGSFPAAGLVFDQKGNLYGTTANGGDDYNEGTAFKLTPKGLETVLHTFCVSYNCPDGAQPDAGLVFDQNGNLYGTTNDGGANGFDGGVIFQLTPRGKYTILHSFCPPYSCDDGASPLSLVFDQQGNLYGATHSGGVYVDGTVFKLTPTGQESVLYSFCAQRYCSDGQYPSGSLLFDQNGNLYGVTSGGGDYGYGAVFKLAR
jgi:uncharacterized repeat protein (TIGR03803 family)